MLALPWTFHIFQIESEASPIHAFGQDLTKVAVWEAWVIYTSWASGGTGM